MNLKKYLVMRWFLMLFTLSVSVAILPCGIANAHGLFGEITASIVVEDREQEIVDIESRQQEKYQKWKGINIINVCFECLIIVTCISFWAKQCKLPPKGTIITQKVRMNN